MTEPLRVLILEDQPEDAELVVRELRRAGFAPDWRRADTEADYLANLSDDIDVILSDYSMPQFNGMRALELLRQRGLDVPFIIISGNIGEDVAVATMRAGAADYLLKDRIARLGPAIEHVLQEKQLREEKGLARRALLDSEELFRKLSECSPLGIMLLDNSGNCTYCNPRGREMIGITLAESARLGWTRPIQRADFESVIQEWLAALHARREFSCVFSVRSPQKGIRWLNARSSPMIWEEGAGQGHVATIEDITERKLLEGQFIQAQKMEVVGLLAGGVAHDFNNILAVIMACNEMMLTNLSTDHPLHKHCAEVREATNRAASLTRQLLAFSRKQILEPKVLDLRQVVCDMEKMLRRLIHQDIELVLRTAQPIGCIKADLGNVEQVVMNLAVNARDAMPEGGTLTIETRNVQLDSERAHTLSLTPGDYVVLAVSDTGTGMTDEVKRHLFEAFYTTKPLGKGTGLGLSTCHNIVNQSSGCIVVHSELGKGTTFEVVLPQVQAVADPVARAVEGEAIPWGTERVLLVEDEPSMREVATQILQQQGYTMLTASNGRDALRVVREHLNEPIDLVVTDFIMPQMNGKAMAESLRTSNPSLKILFTSGYTEDAIVQNSRLSESGISFLPKPYTLATLARRVREVLDSNHQEISAASAN